MEEPRSRALWLLSFFATVAFLWWAQSALIPIAFAVMLSYALTPFVDLLRKTASLPKALGAAVVLTAIVAGAGAGIGSLQPEALDILAVVPRAAQKIAIALRADPKAPPGVLALLQRAANEIDRTANSGNPSTSAPAQVPGFRIRNYVFFGTLGFLSTLAQLFAVLALVYFLLLAGDSFRRSIVALAGRTLTSKKLAIRILDQINRQVQRYVLVQIGSSALFGLCAGAIFAAFGLDSALTWACAGAFLHLVPYAGPSTFILLIALVGFVQFDSVQPVIVILACLMGCLGVIGLLLVPWLTQKTGNLNAVTVFVSLVAWGWLWGVWGLLLGVPIVMAFNVICERVDTLRPMSVVLGRSANGIQRLRLHMRPR